MRVWPETRQNGTSATRGRFVASALCFAAILWGGCSTEPVVTLEPGIYDYGGGIEGGSTYAGTLYIDTSTELEATGHWDVNGFNPDFEGPTGMNGGSYLLSAKVNVGTRWLVIHRIDPETLACSAGATIITTSGTLQTRGVSCTLQRQ